MNTPIEVDYQVAPDVSASIHVPDKQQVIVWVESLLTAIGYEKAVQVSICVVNKQEIAELNEKYRGKNKATNVLSFPYQSMPGIEVSLLGDIVICAEIVNQEAQQQEKSLQQHWAHMIVHGALHLLGYDHIEESDAQQMESVEIEVLSKFGISNPYGETNIP